MLPGFYGRMIGSALIGMLSSFIFPYIKNDNINNIGLTLIMLTIFLIGCSLGEITSNLNKKTVTDKKKK